MLRFPIALVVMLLTLSGSKASAQKTTWVIDRNQTQVNFQIRRVPVSYVRGSFTGITGTVVWDQTDVAKSHVEVVIPTASISTNNAARDSDLKSTNFFDVEKYPTMIFKSTSVTGTPGHLNVVGDLTLAGVTKSVTFVVEGPTEPAKMSKLTIGFSATGLLKRSDFNFASKYPTLILGDEIAFTIDAEADQ